MAGIILQNQWTRQPQYPARPSQLWKPEGLWNFATQNNAVSGSLNTITSAAIQSVGSLGIGVKVSGTASLNRHILNGPSSINIGADNFTVAIAFRLDSTAGYSALSRWNTGGSAGSNVFLLGGSSGFTASTVSFMVEVGTASYEANVSGSWVSGETYFLFGRRKGTSIYVDRYALSTGALVSGFRTDAGITSINEVSARSLKLGELDASASLNADVTGFVAATFRRCLTDAEVRILIGNPWQIFVPPKRILFAPPAAAGLTVTGILGEATASGFTATVDQQRIIAGSVGTATASGFTATVDQQNTITTTIGTATASGFDASVALGDLVVTGIIGTATASGYTATVDQQQAISGIIGTATASAYTAALEFGGFTADQLAFLVYWMENNMAIPTAAQIADAVWQEQIDGSTTAEQSLRLANAVLGGKVSGAGSGQEYFRDLADSKNRVIATVDSSGNRSVVTRDLT